jgi:CubicO group peptidase (beta-lactamase class C family)
LGYLIETLSGHGYENYLQINVLSPLGMINTEYGSSIIEGTGYAMGYTNTSQEQKADFHDMSIPYSAGALSSNIGDLEIWAESFAAGTLVSDQENQEIFMEGDHEFGWFVGEFAGKTAYSYYGGINGFSSFIAIFPEEKGLIIALSNVEGEQPKLNSIVTTITKNEL